jgi:hypothetical protein
MTALLFEKVVLAAGDGERLTLDVGERDGYIVIDITIPGDAAGRRTCLLEPVAAAAFVRALQDAMVRAQIKRES